jgi:hypothetical protein
MLRATLQEENFIVLKNDLAFQLAEALRADSERYIVKKIRPHAFTHWSSVRLRKKLSTIVTNSQTKLTKQPTAHTTKDQKKNAFSFASLPIMNVREQP